MYGCLEGRSCPDVPSTLRPKFDAMIDARIAAGHGTDLRCFHWFWRIDRQIWSPSQVREFVSETLGSPLVADAAEIVVNRIGAASLHDRLDVHVTLLPDRMRLRVDDDYGLGRTGDAATVLESVDADGQPGGLAFLKERALGWGVVGDGDGCSFWADFARAPGDTADLAQNYRMVPAARIPAGAYVYRADDHLAWVPVSRVRVVGGKAYLNALDGYKLPVFSADEQVAVFAPAEAVTP